VVYASSSSVYGDSIVLPKREGQEGRPVSPYALSKRMNEELADTFGRCFGMDLIGLRYFNVYGPRQDPQGPYAAVIPRFFRACLNDEPPVIYGDGLQTRDFTFVSDAVAANLLAAGAPADACGRAYNIATGRQTSLLELAKMIREATGASRPPAHQAPRSGDVPHSVADLTLAGKMLRYRPSTPLDAGLRASRPYYESLNDAAREPGRAPAKTPAYAKREEP
jgi:nucleoside-diphosphate-sugar epimerase